MKEGVPSDWYGRADVDRRWVTWQIRSIHADMEDIKAQHEKATSALVMQFNALYHQVIKYIIFSWQPSDNDRKVAGLMRSPVI